MPKINGNEIKPGNVIEHQGSIWVAVKCQSVKPGKGGAFNQVELKNMLNGSKLNERFRSSETVERVRLEQKSHQYLYDNGDTLAFMDQESFEQIDLAKEFVGEQAKFLQDGMIVEIEFHEETPLGIALPAQVTMTVLETEPAVKGQTAANSFKPAICENGVRVMVPPFINQDEKIIVQTEDGAYLRRAD